jgi:osmoprotectant transport system permease protein
VRCLAASCGVVLLAGSVTPVGANEETVVGSKQFTESVILAEIATQLLNDSGLTVTHRREMGGTSILWAALRTGQIDVYPEYTGTITQEILAGSRIMNDAALEKALGETGVRMIGPLGFSNSYVLGMLEARAEALGIRALSDLAAHPDLVFGLSTEFMERLDGWRGLQQRYRLPHTSVRGIQHDLAYRGLASGALDVIDLYSTDAEIEYYRIRPLRDDLSYFPDYRAVLLCRADWIRSHPSAAVVLARLRHAISQRQMIGMNAAVRLQRLPETAVAADLLRQQLGLQGAPATESRMQRLWRTTRDHLRLVVLSLGAAIVTAIPLGIAAARRPVIARFVLPVVDVIQTLPSLALLVFMIPLLGIGGPPAVAALFLYSLLPIVRNTYSGLHDIPRPLREAAVALGLPPVAQLRLVELPLATRSILSGVKTAAVINVGTATLGALIGAGGYGEPILTGIRLNDLGLVLEGAIPAALLALLVAGFFDLVEARLLPAGLRYRAIR